MGEVLPSVSSAFSSDVRGLASSYAVNAEDTIVDNLELSDTVESFGAEANSDLDIRTIFNPSDLAGYTNTIIVKPDGSQSAYVPEGQAEDDDYYDDEYYYYDDYEEDQAGNEMIDLRGSPLVVDNYNGRRR